MTTKDTIQDYFNGLKQKRGWEEFLADDIIFSSFTSPVRRVTGKDSFLASTKRFYSMINSVEVKDTIIEGDKAVVLTHYELQPPNGNAFHSDVAEIFTISNGKIHSFGIYFDSSPYPK
jgi:ketosteroid isomerase-like protein